MYELTIISCFSSAHNLRCYEGECERLHGHNWKVEVTITSEKLDNIGLAVDFKILKKGLEDILEKLDHKYLNEIPPFDKENPSSENMAKYIFKQFKTAIKDMDIKVVKIKVWESENAAAAYWE